MGDRLPAAGAAELDRFAVAAVDEPAQGAILGGGAARLFGLEGWARGPASVRGD
ncbi:MAG: hypothetical protein U0531_11395 [Dehalococcoidia bacterium]